jgi:hypothetical protein
MGWNVQRIDTERTLRMTKDSDMHFTYQGFTHDHDRRCFTFWNTRVNPVSVFSIEIDLPLLSRNCVPVQEGPMFCLQLLAAASIAGPSFLERLRNYRVLEADFRPLQIERATRAAAKARKRPPHQTLRKPASWPNLYLGTISREH